ncbi:conserved hypothetical protein [Neospora caninum Liverpool]|uniref:Pantothenate kinase n=1 Tax=Neospora caninum (strain Liverpool) TaxID=572307 RepID=F0VKG1_NEOCL|nr:conserved hypothetical protein [Neospora caninum Liverpool]CBZ54562.1 conserved hypothetical protein [Neospora caninum Liverpool]|eukprot:XP_003884592.1 conserved hypothetical protein [Neospora caninum Liverpool]
MGNSLGVDVTACTVRVVSVATAPSKPNRSSSPSSPSPSAPSSLPSSLSSSLPSSLSSSLPSPLPSSLPFLSSSFSSLPSSRFSSAHASALADSCLPPRLQGSDSREVPSLDPVQWRQRAFVHILAATLPGVEVRRLEHSLPCSRCVAQISAETPEETREETPEAPRARESVQERGRSFDRDAKRGAESADAPGECRNAPPESAGKVAETDGFFRNETAKNANEASAQGRRFREKRQGGDPRRERKRVRQVRLHISPELKPACRVRKKRREDLTRRAMNEAPAAGPEADNFYECPLTPKERRGFYPYLLVNLKAGKPPAASPCCPASRPPVAFSRTESFCASQRIGGSTIGGATFMGLCRLILPGELSPKNLLELAATGDNRVCDMLVRDIYGGSYDAIGLKSSTIASTFGKLQHIPVKYLKGYSLAASDREAEKAKPRRREETKKRGAAASSRPLSLDGAYSSCSYLFRRQLTCQASAINSSHAATEIPSSPRHCSVRSSRDAGDEDRRDVEGNEEAPDEGRKASLFLPRLGVGTQECSQLSGGARQSSPARMPRATPTSCEGRREREDENKKAHDENKEEGDTGVQGTAAAAGAVKAAAESPGRKSERRGDWHAPNIESPGRKSERRGDWHAPNIESPGRKSERRGDWHAPNIDGSWCKGCCGGPFLERESEAVEGCCHADTVCKFEEEWSEDMECDCCCLSDECSCEERERDLEDESWNSSVLEEEEWEPDRLSELTDEDSVMARDEDGDASFFSATTANARKGEREDGETGRVERLPQGLSISSDAAEGDTARKVQGNSGDKLCEAILYRRPTGPDIVRSLLTLMSFNVAQQAYLHATLHGLTRIALVGFLLDVPAFLASLQHSVRFWSRNKVKVFFCSLSPFLGALGASLAHARFLFSSRGAGHAADACGEDASLSPASFPASDGCKKSEKSPSYLSTSCSSSTRTSSPFYASEYRTCFSPTKREVSALTSRAPLRFSPCSFPASWTTCAASASSPSALPSTWLRAAGLTPEARRSHEAVEDGEEAKATTWPSASLLSPLRGSGKQRRRASSVPARARGANADELRSEDLEDETKDEAHCVRFSRDNAPAVFPHWVSHPVPFFSSSFSFSSSSSSSYSSSSYSSSSPHLPSLIFTRADQAEASADGSSASGFASGPGLPASLSSLLCVEGTAVLAFDAHLLRPE